LAHSISPAKSKLDAFACAAAPTPVSLIALPNPRDFDCDA
jgi:hypothetical protein